MAMTSIGQWNMHSKKFMQKKINVLIGKEAHWKKMVTKITLADIQLPQAKIRLKNPQNGPPKPLNGIKMHFCCENEC